MTRPLSRLTNALRRFRREDEGNFVLEAVLIIPFLLWGYIALYSYWGAYRTMTDLQKVSYTISDLISREQTTINAGYITGARNTMNAMLGRGEQVRLRVSSVMWRESQSRFIVEWSNSPSGMLPLTTATLSPSQIARIPNMTDGRTAIILEAELDYEPPLSIGLGAAVGLQPMTFREFIVTPPRYAPRIVFR